MRTNWKALATEVISSLSPAEREDSIVYLEYRVIAAGEKLPWKGLRQSFALPVVIAFVDLEPAANWTHRARYIVLKVEGGIHQSVDVDLPPFLTQVSPHLCVIHKGSRAPQWAVVVSAMEQEESRDNLDGEQ